MVWYLLTDKYTDHWKVQSLHTSDGPGIPLFRDETKAQAFIEANWGLLGPGKEPMGLHEHHLADFLEKQASEAGIQWVVYDPPPVTEAELFATNQTVGILSISAFVTLRSNV